MKVAGGGASRISGRKKQAVLKRALKGPNTKPVAAARSKTVVKQYPAAAKKALGGAAQTTKSTRKADNKYLIKASGTTKKEVQGVRSAIKSGRMTKKQGIKSLNESGSRKRVKKALSR